MPAFNPFSGEEHQPFYWMGSGESAALLVHGFPGTPAEMRPLGKVLHQAGWSVQGLLLPGFGPEFSTLRQRKASDWAVAIDQALASLQRDHRWTVLIGFSMGGGLSIQAAAQRSLDGLVLMAPFWRTSGWFWAAMPLLRVLLPTIKPFRVLKLDLANPETRLGMARLLPGADLDDPLVRQGIRDFKFPLSILDELRQVGRVAHRQAFRIKTPTLLVQGEQDKLVRPEATRRLLQMLPGPLCYNEFPAAAHDLPSADAPAWPSISATILSFVNSRVSSPH